MVRETLPGFPYTPLFPSKQSSAFSAACKEGDTLCASPSSSFVDKTDPVSQSEASVKRSTSCFRLAASADSSSLAAALSCAVALLVCTTEEI